MGRGYDRLGQVGAAVGRPWDALAGAVVRQAVEDARYGSSAARLWLLGDGRRWVELLGGLGYLEQVIDEWRGR